MLYLGLDPSTVSDFALIDTINSDFMVEGTDKSDLITRTTVAGGWHKGPVDHDRNGKQMKRFAIFSAFLTLGLQFARAAEMAGPPSPPGVPPFPVVVPEPPAVPMANPFEALPVELQTALQPPPAPMSLRLTTNGATVYCADRFLVKPLAGVPVLRRHA